MKSLGIIGAGRLGIVLGQLAAKAGYSVAIAGSGSPDKIKLTVETLVPGSQAMTSEDVAQKSDVVILAIPLSKYAQLPKDALKNKIVIDATNYWWEVDGQRSDLATSSSEVIQAFLDQSRVVKAFSHIGYHDLYDETRPEGAPDRKAIAIAGDTPEDVKIVSDIVDDLGFDPLIIGNLADGQKLQPGGPVFGVHVGIDALRKLLA